MHQKSLCRPRFRAIAAAAIGVIAIGSINILTEIGGSPSSVVNPAQVLNLTDWKVTLPYDANGNLYEQGADTPGDASEVVQPKLATFSDPTYFYANSDSSGVVFMAPVNGATTSGSEFPRTELRQMAGSSGTTSASWSLDSSAVNSETLEGSIQALPALKPEVVIAQIHSASAAVIEIVADGTGAHGSAYQSHEPSDCFGAGGDINNVGCQFDICYKFDTAENQSNCLIYGYTLGDEYSLTLSAQNGVVQMSATYNGTTNTITLNDTNAKDATGDYFKAGCYTQSNITTEGNYTDYGEATIYDLSDVYSPGPAITSSSATSFTAGTAGSFTVTTAASPTPTLSESGVLPSGVTFVDGGKGKATLAGTPGPGTAGTYPFTIAAANGITPDAAQTFTLTVEPPPTSSPAITSASSTTFDTGIAGTFTVTTTGSPAPALSEPGALPSGVTFTDNGDGTATLAGTPGPGTAGAYPFTVTGANGVAPNAAQAFTLTISDPLDTSSPAITSASSTTFVIGAVGTFTVATAGSPVSSLSESGALPTGVTFADNGDGTATLAGTPTSGAAGTYSFTLTATNGVTPNATQSFTLTVVAPSAITSASSTTFGTGTASTFGITTSGSPIPSLSEAGALPSGVSFTDNGDGTATLAGTPASGAAGTYPLTITATNGVTPDATQSFTLTVTAPLVITNASSTTFGTGTASTFGITTSGSPIPSLSEAGALPSGVSFTDNGDGTATLAGTPAVGSAGTYPLTITATNGVTPDATQSFTLTVTAPLVITNASSTTFSTGTVGSFGITTTGSPIPSLSEAGALPSGVSFIDNGDGTATLAGTPAVGSAGTYPLTITGTNGFEANATQSFTLTVVAPLTIATTASLLPAVLKVAYSVSLAAVGGISPYSWSLASGAKLPSGLKLSSSGVISGTPTTSGMFTFSAQVGDAMSDTAQQLFTLTVDVPIAITSGSSTTFSTGAVGTFSVTTSGSPVPSLSESGALPSGVTFTDNGNGSARLAGTPATGTAGTYEFTIIAANSVTADATKTFTLTVIAPLAITSTASLPPGMLKATYKVSLTAAGGNPSYSWSLASGAKLPSGLKLSSSGVISGTPTKTGAFIFGVQVEDSKSKKAQQSFTMNVYAPLAFTSASSATLGTGTAGTFSVTTSGSPTPSLSESGALPSGVNFTDKENGTATLAGTPATGTAGTYSLTITATNGVEANATQSFALVVLAPLTVTSSATLVQGALKTSYKVSLAAAGGNAPYSWALASGATLPSGLKLSSGGVISGTPTKTGTFKFTVEVEDTKSNGKQRSVSKSLSITVT